MTKLRIDTCDDAILWYADKVGETWTLPIETRERGAETWCITAWRPAHNTYQDKLVLPDAGARRQRMYKPPLQGNAENSARRGHETD